MDLVAINTAKLGTLVLLLSTKPTLQLPKLPMLPMLLPMLLVLGGKVVLIKHCYLPKTFCSKY